MGQILYFVPGILAERQYRDAAKANGFEYLFDCDGLATRHVISGPGDVSGLIGARTTAKRIGYFPDEQEWHKCAGGAFWIGWSGKPGPQDLARKQQISGHVVKLCDGNNWTIPVARWVDESGWRTNLPQTIGLDDMGAWTVKIGDKYRSYWTRALRLFDMICGTDAGDDWDVSADLELCVDALAFNYYLTRWDVAALKLLDTTKYMEVLRAIIDYPGMLKLLEASKKNGIAPDTASIEPGQQASPEATDQPAQISSC